MIFVLIAVVGGTAAATEKKSSQSRLVFTGSTDFGEVWVNVGMTVNRLEQDYLPMVVMVANRADRPVVLDRDSFRLIGADGRRYPMPTVKELRQGYDKLGLDARTASGAGIPWEVWARERRLADSNFFPNMTSRGRALVVEEVTLANGSAMIDALYFAKPRGFTPNQPFILEVQALGWEVPIRLGMKLN